VLKLTVQTVVFFLELLMLMAFGWYGYHASANALLGVVAAAGMITAAIILWAIFAAPRSKYRLKLPALAFFRAAMFLMAAFFIYRLGFEIIALIMAVLAIATQVLSRFTEK
jgi:hypothetical protein